MALDAEFRCRIPSGSVRQTRHRGTGDHHGPLAELHRRRVRRTQRRRLRRTDRPDHRRGVRQRTGLRRGRRRRRDERCRHGVRDRGATPPRPNVSGPCSSSPTPSRSEPPSFVAMESRNTGKPIGLTMSEEIPPAVDQIRFFAGAARMLEGKSAGEYMAGHTSYVRREPIGVCAQVTPWNYPLMMAIWKIAPALAAGNTVVLKPSDTTPASTLLLAEVAAEFFPPGRAERRLRRPRHRPGPGGAPDSADGLDHRLHPGRHAGGAKPPRSTSSAPTWNWAGRHRSSSSTTPTSPRPPRRSRWPGTSTPARTAPRPLGCWPARACTTTWPPRSPSRPVPPGPGCPTTRTCSTAR